MKENQKQSKICSMTDITVPFLTQRVFLIHLSEGILHYDLHRTSFLFYYSVLQPMTLYCIIISKVFNGY